MKKSAVQYVSGLVSALLLTVFGESSHAQVILYTNFTFDAAASATPPAWGVWPNGVGNYVTNGWSSSDASNSPSSGSLLVTSTFTGASQQSVVWNGHNGGFNPPLNAGLITNLSCYIRFDPSSPTNSSTSSYGSLAFYVTLAANGGSATMIGPYFHPPAGNTNWVFYSVPISASGSIYAIEIQLETYGNALTGTSKMYVDNLQLRGAAPQAPTNGTAVVDWNNVHQRIDGFGASSAWETSFSSAEADVLFSTNNNISYNSGTYNGVGLSLLRSHIQYGSTTSANEVLTSGETNIMQMAQARGTRVWSAPWTPAAGFKSTNDIYDSGIATAGGVDGGSFLGIGNNITNVNYASQLANYVVNMRNNYGINIYGVSIQNEPDANVTSYEACQWNGTQIHDFVTNFYAALAAKGVGATKIIAPESEDWAGDWALMTPSANDPNVLAEVGIFANHDYVADNSVGDQAVPAPLPANGKTTWETEVALLSGSDSSMVNGIYTATRIHLYMTRAQVNAYHHWWLVAQGSGNQGLLDTSANPTKRLFVFGQFSRFVRPNFYRIDATSSQTSALVSAYKDSASPAFAVVVVNANSASDIIETVTLTNFTAVTVTPWITSGTSSLAPLSPVVVTNHSFTYDVPAMSVMTFVGQGNTPPQIVPVANQTINPGVTLLVTNTASDSDLPAQTLTFAAANPFPANATVNASNGVFSWRPLVSQAATTNLIQIQVTDNGSPNLSATNSFNVFVNGITNPGIGGVSVVAGQVRMTMNGPLGPDYTGLTSTNLTNWQTLFTTNSPVVPFTFTDTNIAGPARFYRFEIGP